MSSNIECLETDNEIITNYYACNDGRTLQDLHTLYDSILAEAILHQTRYRLGCCKKVEIGCRLTYVSQISMKVILFTRSNCIGPTAFNDHYNGHVPSFLSWFARAYQKY